MAVRWVCYGMKGSHQHADYYYFVPLIGHWIIARRVP